MKAWWLGATLGLVTLACGDDAPTFGEDGTGANAGTGAGDEGASGGTSAAGAASASGGAGASPAGGAGASGGAGGSGGQGAGAALDPTVPGPYTTAALSETAALPGGGSATMDVRYPAAGPDDGPYPVILFGHGFQLPPSQYFDYLERLATFGYVAVSVDFSLDFFAPSHVDAAEQLLHGLDWVEGHGTLGPIADANNAGASGHSLGGKLAVYAATVEPRIKATIVLDPVDSSPAGCSASDCPDVSMALPIAKPTGFLGETLDASGGAQSCAPAADNYATFFGSADSPSLEVTVVGANHMSFLDDVASCGIPCLFCNAATADNAAVNGLAKAYLVAFYERHLRGNVAYDTYLTGPQADALFFQPGLATIQSK